jgi:hypothetical protein
VSVPQFSTSKTHVARQGSKENKEERYRIARGISVAITSMVILVLCYWSIEAGVNCIRYFASYFSFDELKDATKETNHGPMLTKESASTESEDRRLRGMPEQVGVMSHHHHAAKRKYNNAQVFHAIDQTNIITKSEASNNQMNSQGQHLGIEAIDQTNKITESETNINQMNSLAQNLGEDATTDFFYAGKFIHQEYDETLPGDGSFAAYSYATLPFSDCNPFVLSVWIYLSPDEERGEKVTHRNDDKPPRVILTTRTKEAGDGCTSDLFGGSSSDSATGMILYAMPHYGDDTNENGETYKIMLEYAVANEMRCRTLVGTALIREREWHHGELHHDIFNLFTYKHCPYHD